MTMVNEQHISDIKTRRLFVERALAIVTTAAQAPNSLFMHGLEQFIAGEISLEELERNVDQFQYLNSN